MKHAINIITHWLFDPHRRITSRESIQRARLLSAIVLVLLVLISTILALVLHADPDDITEPTVQGAFGLLGVCAITYVLNKAGYTGIAAAGIILPITGLFIYIPFYSGESPIFLAFLLIPIILNALFYSPRWTVINSVLLLGGLFLLISMEDQVSDSSPFWNLRNLWYFLVIGTGLILTFITHGRTLENIRRDALNQLNAQLKENEARLRALVENSPDFILEINRLGDILFINGFTELYLGKNVRDVLPSNQHDLAFHAIEKAFATGVPQAIEIQILIPSGPLSWYSARVGPVKQGDVVSSLTVILTDITAQKEVQEQIHQLNKSLEARVAERTVQLEAANRDLEAFSYSVSHDLRSPLRGINGFSRLLMDQYASQMDDQGQHFITRIHENTERMNQLIEDLLEFSRLGRKELHTQTIAPASLAREVLADLQGELEGRQVTVTIAEDLPACEADPALLRQVFANLFGNAFK